MKERLKNLTAVILVILLLPYVIAIIWNGDVKTDANTSRTENKYIIVSFNGGEEKIDIEQYIVGILPSQISIAYEKEAIKAQALIIRTDILNKMEDRDTITEEEIGQQYMTLDDMEEAWGKGNFDDNYLYLTEAVEETYGEAIYYADEIIEPSFHAVSAGKTRNVGEMVTNSKYPYYKSVDSSWDLNSDQYLQSVQMDKGEVIADLQIKNEDLQVTEDNLLDSIQIEKRDSAGYINSIKVGNTTMTGEEFRECLGLNSAAFTIDEFEGKIRIITKGLGHGIGLSQYGANCMAAEGKDYKAILNYYYNDIEIRQCYE